MINIKNYMLVLGNGASLNLKTISFDVHARKYFMDSGQF